VIQTLVINKNSYVQLPVAIHLINVNNNVYWLHHNYIVYLKMYYIYSFIQYYKTIYFFYIYKLSYCTAGFHIERYLIYFSGVRNPGKVFNLPANRFLILILYLFHEDYIQPEATSSSPHFLRPLQWYHTNTNRKWHRSFTNTAESKYESVHTELVQLFYDIKWISSGTFEFEQIKQQTIPLHTIMLYT
jgi:hypothetical protein